MPHSVSPEDPPSPDQDAIVEEPKTDYVETQGSEGTAVADSIGPIGESQASDDQDMTMADADVEEEKTPVKAEPAADIKLEDLFADMDSDDEFPSSTDQDMKISSSPEAPASPV
jgi:DNA primase small subunit